MAIFLLGQVFKRKIIIFSCFWSFWLRNKHSIKEKNLGLMENRIFGLSLVQFHNVVGFVMPLSDSVKRECGPPRFFICLDFLPKIKNSIGNILANFDILLKSKILNENNYGFNLEFTLEIRFLNFFFRNFVLLRMTVYVMYLIKCQ